MTKLVSVTMKVFKGGDARKIAADMGLLGPNASLIADLFKVHKILASRARTVVICGGPAAYTQWHAYRMKLDAAFERRMRNLELQHDHKRDD